MQRIARTAPMLAVADRVYVLEHGRFAREDTPRDLAVDDEIRRMYLGV